MEHFVLQKPGSKDQDRYFFDKAFALGNITGVFCGVYDGHGPDGAIVAEYIANYLPRRFCRGFQISENMTTAFRSAYRGVSAEAEFHNGGCVAVNAYYFGDQLVVANAGDCRIITVGNGWKQLTRDHIPSAQSERERLVSQGCVIKNGYACLLENEIGVSRNLGHGRYKPFGIISTPRVRRYQLSHLDTHIVIASDGLWTMATNDEVAAVIQKRPSPENACNCLFNFAMARGLRDDFTMIVIAR